MEKNGKLKPTQTVIDPGLIKECITEIKTEIGYLQMLEYTLPDQSLLHIVSYNYFDEFEENKTWPKIYQKTFYNQKDKAYEYVHEIGNNLLKQYL